MAVKKLRDAEMKKLQVTLTKSTIGSTKSQKATVQGLGLRKINSTRVLNNTPAIRGMVKKVLHLVDVEELEE
jgi:large subunit ribosomal protein L30